MRTRLCLSLIALLMPLTAFAQAGAARLVPFQGVLTDGSAQPITDVDRVTFAIYDAPTSGNELWSETHESVSIVAGQINVLLGALTSLDAPGGGRPPVCFAATGAGCGPKYLGIKVGADSNQEMIPRHQLVPAFHARSADIASATTDGAVRTNMIADDAIISTKIADGAVSSTSIAAGAITSANIANQTITALKLAPGAVTSGGIADEAIALNNMSDLALAWILPAGSVIAFAGSSVPDGFLACNGAAISRALYPDLFGAIGVVHGDGTTIPGGGPSGFSGTHFNLPDYRGRFLRGLDGGIGRDPDRSGRVPAMPGGAAGDAVGSVQGHEFASHRHPVNVVNTDPSGSPAGIDSTPATSPATTLSNPVQAAGGSETRPVNAYVQYVIKCGKSDGC
jgi:hypothetical protein